MDGPFKANAILYLGIPTYAYAAAEMFVVAGVGVALYPELFFLALTWILIFAPVWGPIALGALFWSKWRKYIRYKYLSQSLQQGVLLEIRIPREIFKSPRAMELVLTGLAVGPGETTFVNRWWQGRVRPNWSLEIASFEGQIHFYVWTWQRMRDFTEAQFYAQYPDIEIYEVEDYTAGIDPTDAATNLIWGMEYRFGKPDAYPIKTYIDWELDKEPRKAEQVTDPLSGLLEQLSAIGPGEQMWVQFVIRHNKGAKNRSMLFAKRTTWKDEAKEEIDAIYDAARPKTYDFVQQEITEGYPLLQPAQVMQIKALERSVEKPGFDTGIRSVYVARPENFSGHRLSPYLVHLLKSFNSGHLNSFKPLEDWHVSLDYPWQDFRKLQVNRFSRRIIDAYRRRAMFYPPYERDRMVLTSEELATLWHFPAQETRTPGIERIGSTKSEPPANLPV